MSDLLHCSVCNNDLIPGITSGPVACPACATPLPVRRGLDGELRATTKKSRRGLSLRQGVAIPGVLLLMAGIAALRLSVPKRTESTVPLVGSLEYSSPVSAGAPVGITVGRPPGMSQSDVDMQGLASDILLWQQDAASDPTDFGVQMRVLRRWEAWFDSSNLAALKLANWNSYAAAASRVYEAAVQSPHVRADQPELVWSYHWLVALKRRLRMASPTPRPSEPWAVGSFHLSGPKLPASAVFSPGTQPPWLENLSSGAPVDSWLDPPRVMEGLRDAQMLCEQLPGSPYSWRRHAEMMFAAVTLNIPEVSGDAAGRANEMVQDLLSAQKLARSKLGREMTTLDYQRLLETSSAASL